MVVVGLVVVCVIDVVVIVVAVVVVASQINFELSNSAISVLVRARSHKAKLLIVPPKWFAPR